VPEEHGNPLADLQGSGTKLAATIIAQAGAVRHFREAGALVRFCSAAPIPRFRRTTWPASTASHPHESDRRHLFAAGVIEFSFPHQISVSDLFFVAPAATRHRVDLDAANSEGPHLTCVVLPEDFT
jgi:hypothetical protein